MKQNTLKLKFQVQCFCIEQTVIIDHLGAFLNVFVNTVISHMNLNEM